MSHIFLKQPFSMFHIHLYLQYANVILYETGILGASLPNVQKQLSSSSEPKQTHT